MYFAVIGDRSFIIIDTDWRVRKKAIESESLGRPGAGPTYLYYWPVQAVDDSAQSGVTNCWQAWFASRSMSAMRHTRSKWLRNSESDRRAVAVMWLPLARRNNGKRCGADFKTYIKWQN